MDVNLGVRSKVTARNFRIFFDAIGLGLNFPRRFPLRYWNLAEKPYWSVIAVRTIADKLR